MELNHKNKVKFEKGLKTDSNIRYWLTLSLASGFKLDLAKILFSGNELNPYQMTNFRLIIFERICR